MASHRRGFTIIELMVLVLIVAVLIGLVLPAIQKSRRISCRQNCSRNLKIVGLGLQSYLNVNNVYPNAGTFREGPGTTNPSASTIRGCFTDVTGVGFDPTANMPSNRGTDLGPLHSWVVDILPYLDQEDMADAWNHEKIFASTVSAPGEPSNALIGSKAIGILTCPEDTTVQPGQGNLSYVVNGGFSRWVGDPSLGWTGTANGGSGTRTGPDWGIDVAAQTGVMFLGSDMGDKPWDRKTTAASVVDGSSQTILVSENLLAGASTGSPATSGLPTNWACPHPNVVMFIASDKVCPGGRCPTLQGSSSDPGNPNAFAPANAPTNNRFESINSSVRYLAPEGTSPFPSSNHSGGVNVLICDGSVRFIKDTIDGSVYASLITPAGSTLPAPYWAPHVTHCEY
jgi:prepilin-type processing-associated H-X9-DG protein